MSDEHYPGRCDLCVGKSPDCDPGDCSSYTPRGVLKDRDPWKDAVIDACTIAWVDVDERNAEPRKAINDLIQRECEIALDPCVSTRAKAMVDRAEKAERELDSTLKRIAAVMGCEPDDADDLVEAVRLLVGERDEARQPIAVEYHCREGHTEFEAIPLDEVADRICKERHGREVAELALAEARALVGGDGTTQSVHAALHDAGAVGDTLLEMVASLVSQRTAAENQLDDVQSALGNLLDSMAMEYPAEPPGLSYHVMQVCPETYDTALKAVGRGGK